MVAQDYLNEIYMEGQIDWLSFGYLGGWVGHDPEVSGPEKSDLDIFNDTSHLIGYLVQIGDFEAGHIVVRNGCGDFVVYSDGFSEFAENAKKHFKEEGLRCPDLMWVLGIKKILLNKPAPEVSDSIAKLFWLPE